MSNINTLVENYRDVINRHTEIINNKANTFEESYIYQNDILNVKEQKFDNISVCFQALRNKVNYIKNSINRETEFNNIAVSLDNLISKFDMCIDTLQENSEKINLASKAAYEEYCKEFKEDDDIWNEIKCFTNDHFSKYYDFNQTLYKMENSLNFAIATNADPEKIETLEEDCERQEFKVEGALNTISDDIRILLEYNAKLIDLLNKALKKGTAVY